jgi:hypothetical protein
MRRAVLAVVFLGAVAVVLVAVAGLGALAMRRDLDVGRDAMLHARAAFTRGDLETAADGFRAARKAFDDADEAANNAAFRLVSAIPLLGRTFDGVVSLADGGELTARAGERVASAFAASGGVEGLVGSHGRIALDRLPTLAAALEDVAPMLEDAAREVASAPTSLVPGALRDARATAADQLADAIALVRTGGALLERLPAFLGADRPVTYLVGAENPAELRASGGVMGAYALLRIDDGLIQLSSFRQIQSLPLPDGPIPPPNADYARLYDDERAGADDAFWLNVNLTPDFPSAALAFERSFEAATGTPVDGVITADPFALEALVEATGPTDIPALGLTVRADDVVPLLSSQGFELVTDPAARKHLLGEAAGAIVDRAVTDANADVVRHLFEAASDGHLKVYSDDPAMQAALARTGAGGALETGDGDFLAVVTNNAAGNKLDYYMHREITYDVWLEPDGATRSRVAIAMRNETPDEPLPVRVLGKGPSIGMDVGETLSLVNAYCVRCGLISATDDGAAVEATGGSELGTTFFQRPVDLRRGRASDLVFEWGSRDVWHGDGSSGRYTLTLQGQTTIVPTPVTVRIHLPEGVDVSDDSDAMRVGDNIVTWRGTPVGRVQLDVAFETPSLLGVWRDVTSTFG